METQLQVGRGGFPLNRSGGLAVLAYRAGLRQALRPGVAACE